MPQADYKPDYKVTTGHGKRAPAVVTPFIWQPNNMNDTQPDYGSHLHRCSHPVVTLNAAENRHSSPLTTLTTPLEEKRDKKRKWWAGKGYAREAWSRSQGRL